MLMAKYILKRLAMMVLVVLGISFIVFTLSLIHI